MTMTRAALLALASVLLAAPGHAQDGAPSRPQAIAPITSWEVTTNVRTLRGCPLKRVIASATAWDQVTADLQGAPPRPSFDGQVVLLVVADITGDAQSWLDGGLQLLPTGDLRVRLYRREPAHGTDVGADPGVKAFFVVLPAFPGGVRLDHRTELAGGGGYIDRPAAVDPSDRDPTQLPELGPDLSFTYAMADGSPAPSLASMRIETRYARPGIPTRVRTLDFPGAGLGTNFPAIGKDEVRHLFAAHADGLRSTNPFTLRALPPDGPGGSPKRLRHHFLLEPAPVGDRPR